MKILILGGDGYLGWPTAMYFSKQGHDVKILDNFVKKKIEIMLYLKFQCVGTCFEHWCNGHVMQN